MGWFEYLFCPKPPSNITEQADRIWINSRAKHLGIGKELVQRSRSDSDAIFLVAHFQDTLEALQSIASEHSVELPVMVTLAEQLTKGLGTSVPLNSKMVLDLLVIERHPLWDRDEQLVRSCEKLPCRCRLVHHLSLDDPLMRRFNGPWVADLMSKMGMTEEEPIESAFVSRRIKSAQKKIQSEATGNEVALSAKEWFEKNLPNLG